MQTHAAADPFGIVGQVLDGQFRVDRLVGEGGFSAVYRGHHLGLSEPIAIKCLKLPPNLSPPLVEQFAKRFRDESRILYRLSQGNLNVVRSIAAGTWGTPAGLMVPYMILEWLEGRSLANEFTIRRTVGNQGRSLNEVVKLFASAADGLAYAHAQGVVHRDLNPGNLFLAATPQGTKMKVLDFGVAKILDDSTLNIGPRTQTVGQIRIFAPAYGAPEQFDDSVGQVGAASDVYSFALILLEAMRDRSVNDGAHLGEFAQRAIDPNHRPTPRAFGLEVTPEVEQIFSRATKLDPRERWQSAGELWQALAIATNAAMQQRHAQAAAETPPLNMPVPRGTQSGMGPKPPRMDKTVPLGVTTPKLNPRSAEGGRRPEGALNQPGQAPQPPAAPPAPKPAISDSTRRVQVAQVVAQANARGDETFRSAGLSDEDDDEAATRVGRRDPASEVEDEVTRVRAPDQDMLRQINDAAPRPAAGAPPPPPAPEQKSFGSTIMMGSPASPTTLAPPPQPHRSGGPFAGTMPLAPPMAPPGALPPPQAPPPSGHTMIAGPGAGGMSYSAPLGPPPMMQAPAYAVPPGTSLPPGSIAGVPKKSSAPLVLGLVFGMMLLVGVAGIAVFLVRGKKDDLHGMASATASIASVGPAESAEPPPTATVSAPPPAPTESAAAPEPEADAGELTPPTATVTAAPPETATAAPPPQPVEPRPTPAEPRPAPAEPREPRPVAVKDAGAPIDPNAFNEALARTRLGQANGVLVFCNQKGLTGPGSATVTFNPDGSVGAVALDPPYAGTPAGDCVAGQFRRQKITPFQGTPHPIKHSFDVPK